MRSSRPIRTVDPAVALATTAEIKMHCRIDIEEAEDNALLDSLVASATAHFDGWAGILGRCLANQTWRQDFTCWPGSGVLRLPFPDVSSAVLTYRDTADAEQTVTSTLYEINEDALGAYIRFGDAFTAPSLPSDREFPVTATLVAGYGATAAAVPAPIRTAVLMLAAHLYENREATAPGQVTPLPMGVDALTAPYRRNRI